MEPLFLGLRHVALNVRDVRKSVEFYSNVLGMKLEWMPDEENAYLALQKLSRQKRRPIREIAEAIILSEELRTGI